MILPQGEFAQFLHDKPSDRQDLLVKLLDLGIYERMRSRGAQLADEKANEVALDEQMIERFADCTPEALEAAKAEVAALARCASGSTTPSRGSRSWKSRREAAVARGARPPVGCRRCCRRVKVPKQVRSMHAERDRAVAAQNDAADEVAAADAEIAREGRSDRRPRPIRRS